MRTIQFQWITYILPRNAGDKLSTCIAVLMMKKHISKARRFLKHLPTSLHFRQFINLWTEQNASVTHNHKLVPHSWHNTVTTFCSLFLFSFSPFLSSCPLKTIKILSLELWNLWFGICSKAKSFFFVCFFPV